MSQAEVPSPRNNELQIQADLDVSATATDVGDNAKFVDSYDLLFDANWYCDGCIIVGIALPASVEDAPRHYNEFGHAAGISPHPLFDPDWYVGQNPGAAGEMTSHNQNPLQNYIAQPSAQRRTPHPLFDADAYLNENADVDIEVRAGRTTALAHYLGYGHGEGRKLRPTLGGLAWLAVERNTNRFGDWKVPGSPDSFISFISTQLAAARSLRGQLDVDVESVLNRTLYLSYSEYADTYRLYLSGNVEPLRLPPGLYRVELDVIPLLGGLDTLKPSLLLSDAHSSNDPVLIDFAHENFGRWLALVAVSRFGCVDTRLRLVSHSFKGAAQQPLKFAMAITPVAQRGPSITWNEADYEGRSRKKAQIAATPEFLVDVIHPDIIPLYQIDVPVETKKLALNCLGPDPQTMLVNRIDASPLTLPPGSYKIIYEAVEQDGHIVSPALYLDIGSGMSEEPGYKEILQKIRSGLWEGYFTSDSNIIALRFDPSEGPCLIRDALVTLVCGVKRPDHATQVSSEMATIYKQLASVAAGSRAPFYAPPRERPAPVSAAAVLIIAFYLPQFHTIPENDLWWGTGFTEWTNVSKAVPQFVGHNQPRLPGELGFYDLRRVDIIKKQIVLAKHYGLSGFCFHYYWFSGKRLLEGPLDSFVQSTTADFDFPFCLCWANENWTRRWDGHDNEVLMAQQHNAGNHKLIFKDILRYVRDKRYIFVDGKPVIVIYRPLTIPDLSDMLRIWRNEAVAAGLPGLMLFAANSFGFTDAASVGLDGIVEFPPHGIITPEVTDRMLLAQKGYAGKVYSYDDAAGAAERHLSESCGTSDCTYCPGVMPDWDNEARRPGKGHTFEGATPQRFAQWLNTAVLWAAKRQKEGRQHPVFINAWNEWGEGAYLEPDRYSGYANLSAVAAVREEEARRDGRLLKNKLTISKRSSRTLNETAIFIHLYYPSLIGEIAERLVDLKRTLASDLIVTIPDTWSKNEVMHLRDVASPNAVLTCPNKGRDVAPFLEALRQCNSRDYKFGCKIHGKKSLHLKDGGVWRRAMLHALLDAPFVGDVMQTFARFPKVGLVAPSSLALTANDASTMRDNGKEIARLLERAGLPVSTEIKTFVAGTMFWFRFETMLKLAALDFSFDDFGLDTGAVDGTLAHAFERTFPTLVEHCGYEVALLGDDLPVAPY